MLDPWGMHIPGMTDAVLAHGVISGEHCWHESKLKRKKKPKQRSTGLDLNDSYCLFHDVNTTNSSH